MLLVNAKAGPSPVHGTGLIAQELIPRGTVVWVFKPGFDVLISKDLLGNLPIASRAQALYWSFFHVETQTYVMSSDDDRFTNHSESPNTRVFGNCTKAVRDIHAGEEITNNYEELQRLDYRLKSETEGLSSYADARLKLSAESKDSPLVSGSASPPHRYGPVECVGGEGGVRIGHCKHGLGVFASRPFQEGEEILRFEGPTVSLAQALKRGDGQANVLQIGPELYVDIGEPAVLVNHHCDPNAGILNDRLLIAIKAIRQGDEICYDYSTTMWEDIWTMPCHCGSGTCRGLITDFPTLPIETQQKYLGLGVVQGFIRLRLASGK